MQLLNFKTELWKAQKHTHCFEIVLILRKGMSPLVFSPNNVIEKITLSTIAHQLLMGGTGLILFD